MLPRILGLVALLFGNVLFADRYSYLDEPCDPYYVGTHFPKLTTPQWVGEAEVEAVVILSIDDMRDSEKYEAFLRPILDRLKKIDGRTPLTIFTNDIDANDPRLQQWLTEGISLEIHTIDHPCPLLKDGDIAKAKSTYDRCVDLMNQIPNNRPVAFRMPCCDSLNTPSPRFYAEIFNKTTAKENFLAIDSSVFNIFTVDDKELPQELTNTDDGKSRFRHYLPFPSFVNTIENYPYPYVIGQRCWQFPCVVPSDWEAQNIQQPNNPKTVEDLKRALDATVIKKGVMPIVFHPHGWIRNDQLADFVDYAQQEYGKRVKFLNFGECLERVNKNLLDGKSLRTSDGNSELVRIADINNDGYMDVLYQAAPNQTTTKIWQPDSNDWLRVSTEMNVNGIRFGSIQGNAYILAIDDAPGKDVSRFVSFEWTKNHWSKSSMPFDTLSLKSLDDFRLRDLDNDGTSELFLTRDGKTQLISLAEAKSGGGPLPFGLPDKVLLYKTNGSDAGLRFRDINADGFADIVYANSDRYGIWLFTSMEKGWSQKVVAGNATDAGAVPQIVRADGTNNGAWFHSDHLWVQNEDTHRLPDLVDRLSFKKLLADASNENAELSAPKAPNEAIHLFKLSKGVRVELVASEPDIADPIAFDWGPDGKIWVVEMRDYPNGLTWHGPGDPKNVPGGRIKMLEDTDRDGKHDKSHVFMDELTSPTGIKAWRKGVLIMSPPDILYAEDTNGDGKADVKEVLYQGLTVGNQQHRANGLRWGLDHWLHVANGDSGGNVKSAKTGDEVNIRGRDFKIKPDEGLIETTSGQTQFGRSRDDQGNWFGGNNSNPVWQYVLEEEYQNRNPYVAAKSPTWTISRTPGAAPVFPTSKTIERFNDFDRANRYTSACSPEVYRDMTLIGSDSRKFIYVCEPVHNLVAREVIEYDGLTVTSSRDPSEQQSDFAASSDNWFRPVMCRTAPDGTLWVADMYRMVIEHPEWIPMEWQKKLDHLAGFDRGRIYRFIISEVGGKEGLQTWAQLDRMATKDLVKTLDSANGTLRDMVQQVLLWRKDLTAVADLKHLLSNANWPQAYPHALYLLHAFGALDDEYLTMIMNHRGGTMLRHGLRICEQRMNASTIVKEAVLNAISPNSQQSFDLMAQQQLALTLGDLKDERAGVMLARLARYYSDHSFMTASLLSSLNQSNIQAVVKELVSPDANRRWQEHERNVSADFLNGLIETIVGYENRIALADVMQLHDSTLGQAMNLDQTNILATVVNAAKRHRKELKKLLSAETMTSVASAYHNAQSIVSDDGQPLERRVAMLELFGFDSDSRGREIAILTELCLPNQPIDLQRTAVQRLAAFDSDDAIVPILNQWQALTPSVQASLLDLIMTKDAWVSHLLSSVKSGQVLPVQVNVRRREQLRAHRNREVRNLAQSMFTETESDRGSVVAKYMAAKHDGQSNVGKALFAKHCSSCHELGGEGKNVGPNLNALTDKSTESLMIAILDPNRAVEDKYLDYAVVTDDGRTIAGMLLNESNNAITLAGADGKANTLLRSQVEQIKATGRSLMPTGFEQTITPAQMHDLIAFVQQQRVPRKEFAGNEPQIAPMRDDGSIRLFGMHANIYGPTIVFEQKYRNLGFWQSESDYATWQIDVPKARNYEIVVDYACPEEHAGGRFVLKAGGKSVGTTVGSTGSWDQYQGKKVGMIELPKGRVVVSIEADGPINGFLMDLRTVLLYPK